jgi:hypothetical protein
MHRRYLGVEAVFNSRNYWVNMQDCSKGLGNLHYDLGDSSRWEFVFPQAEASIPVIVPGTTAGAALVGTPSSAHLTGAGDAPEDRVLDIPASWVNKISLDPQDFETRCPKVCLLGLAAVFSFVSLTFHRLEFAGSACGA